ncbi:MAG: murein biosynthesis integral membrane protein MurJ [Candidatus Sumerlaeia bacterium]
MSAVESPSSERRQFLRATAVVSAFTLLSRGLGVVRDAVIAARLGAGAMSDIFNIAFEIPHLARRVLGEGALSAFIVPVYSEVRQKLGDERAWAFVSNALNILALLTFLMTVAGMLGAKYLFLAFGGFGFFLGGETELLAMGAAVTRIMFPYVMLMTLSALLMGVLHAWRRFTMPALGSIILNCAMIFAGLVFRSDERGFVFILAWAVVAGGVLRTLVLVPDLARLGFRWRARFVPGSGPMRRLFAMMGPALLGVFVVQLNISVDLNFATSLDKGVATFLRYSNRLIQFPLAIIAASLSTAILPSLTGHLLRGERADLARLMTFAVRLTLFLFVPATAGLLALGQPLIRVILERGRWSEAMSDGAFLALAFYALGLVPLALQRILTPLYYARQDVWTPFWASVWAIATNIVLNFILMRTPLRHGGLALATSIAAGVNVWLLARRLKGEIGGLIGPAVWETAVKATVAAVLMGGVCLGVQRWIVQPLLGGSHWSLSAGTMANVVLGAGLFGVFAAVLGMTELSAARRILLARRRSAADRNGPAPEQPPEP